jgi:hypothetical protein
MADLKQAGGQSLKIFARLTDVKGGAFLGGEEQQSLHFIPSPLVNQAKVPEIRTSSHFLFWDTFWDHYPPMRCVRTPQPAHGDTEQQMDCGPVHLAFGV